MYFLKTDKAVAELASRQRTLGLKERALLLLADGKKTGPELASLVQAETTLIHTLLNQGYLAPLRTEAEAAPPARNNAPAPAAAAVKAAPAASASRLTTAVASSADKTPIRAAEPPRVAEPVRVAADTFEGKRSLATARMFLFDLTERMFARRDPALVVALRERFRDARDRESMLAVARDLLQRVEQEAGAARADDISARLAMLLPDEISHA